MAQAHGNRPPAGRVDDDADDVAVSSSPSCRRRRSPCALEMRKLWEDHITWTRLAIISLERRHAGHRTPRSRGCCETRWTSGTRSSPTTATPPATRSPRSCATHILIAAELIAAAKAGRPARSSPTPSPAGPRTPTRSPRTLHSVNPRYWKLAHDEGRDAHAPEADDTPRQSPGLQAALDRRRRGLRQGARSTSCACRTCSQTASSSSSRRGSAGKNPAARDTSEACRRRSRRRSGTRCCVGTVSSSPRRA